MSTEDRDNVDEVLEERLRRGLARLAEAATALPPPARHPAFWRGAGPRESARRRWWWVPMLPALSALGAGAVVAASILVPLGTTHANQVKPIYRPGYMASSLAASLPGALAYVDAGELYSAEPGSSPAPVAHVFAPSSSPQWSPDGQWLAYLGPKRGLHVVSVDGSQVETGLGGPVVAMTWSPTADVLAALPISGPDEGRLVLLGMPGQGLGPMRIVPVTQATGITSFAWSPGGRRIAVSTPPGGPYRHARLEVVELASMATSVLPYEAPAGASLLLGGWWPDGGGLLAWVDPGGSPTSEATGLDLMSIPLGASQATLLERTLVYLPWLAWSPGGNRLLLVHSSGALPWAGTGLALCRPAQGTCQDLPEPPGSVQFDPAWSPDGRTIAFVQATAEGGLTPGVGLDAWYRTRTLFVESPNGQHPRQLRGAGTGVAEPRFSPGGSEIAVATASSIEVVPVSGGNASVIAAGLSGALSTAGPDGYGKLPWGGLAIWGP